MESQVAAAPQHPDDEELSLDDGELHPENEELSLDDEKPSLDLSDLKMTFNTAELSYSWKFNSWKLRPSGQ